MCSSYLFVYTLYVYASTPLYLPTPNKKKIKSGELYRDIYEGFLTPACRHIIYRNNTKSVCTVYTTLL